jgi:hypothetical protein
MLSPHQLRLETVESFCTSVVERSLIVITNFIINLCSYYINYYTVIINIIVLTVNKIIRDRVIKSFKLQINLGPRQRSNNKFDLLLIDSNHNLFNYLIRTVNHRSLHMFPINILLVFIILLVICNELVYCQKQNVAVKRTKGKSSGGQSSWETERSEKALTKGTVKAAKTSLFQKDSTEGGEEVIVHPQSELIKKLEGESVTATDGSALPQRKLMEVPVSPGSTTMVKMWVKVDDAGEPILS